MDLLPNKPILGWEYVFMNDGVLGVGKVTRAGEMYSALEWEIEAPNGEIIKRSAVVWNNNLMNGITDEDKVIQRIKDLFDDNYILTEEEQKAFDEHIRKEYPDHKRRAE